jgi:hypothetical protein
MIFWLSFAGDEGNRGCCMVEAPDFLAAVREAHRLGCNPGGEVKGTELSDGPEVRAAIDRWGLGKIITRQMMEAAGRSGFARRNGLERSAFSKGKR